MSDATDQPPLETVTVTAETDAYASAMGGIEAEMVRIGPGSEPSVVFGMGGEQLVATSARIGFPVTSCAQVPADRIAALWVQENPAESRYCGVPLRKGSLYVYPPSAEHVGIGRPGMRFAMVVADLERLMSIAERLGLPAGIPRCGSLHEIPRSSVTERMCMMGDQLAAPGVGSPTFERNSEQALAVLAEVLSHHVGVRKLQPRRGLDSRVIVMACIDYAAAIERVPSIAELCAASNVSERRLGTAFNQEFDQSPTVYFRAWALDRAHRRLRDAAPDGDKVSDVAYDLGFGHLGRFAGWYRSVYGQSPSKTLHTFR